MKDSDMQFYQQQQQSNIQIYKSELPNKMKLYQESLRFWLPFMARQDDGILGTPISFRMQGFWMLQGRGFVRMLWIWPPLPFVESCYDCDLYYLPSRILSRSSLYFSTSSFFFSFQYLLISYGTLVFIWNSSFSRCSLFLDTYSFFLLSSICKSSQFLQLFFRSAYRLRASISNCWYLCRQSSILVLMSASFIASRLENGLMQASTCCVWLLISMLQYCVLREVRFCRRATSSFRPICLALPAR